MPTKNSEIDSTDVEQNKKIATLSYVFILFLMPLLLKHNSKYAQFHAKQGLALFVVELVVFVISWIPFIGQVLVLAMFVISIIGIIKTLNGEWWEIPFIYDWSQRVKIK